MLREFCKKEKSDAKHLLTKEVISILLVFSLCDYGAREDNISINFNAKESLQP